MKINPIPAFKTVLSAFFGVRKQQDSKVALARLEPLQIIFAALLCAVVFITCLVILVRTIAG